MSWGYSWRVPDGRWEGWGGFGPQAEVRGWAGQTWQRCTCTAGWCCSREPTWEAAACPAAFVAATGARRSSKG